MKTEILVAERQVAERALRESEHRYKRLLTASTGYIYSVDFDRDGTVHTAHGPGCEAVTGYAPSEFAADPYLWYRVVHEEDRPAVVAQVTRIMNGESPPLLEHRIMHKTGSIRWISNTPIPHRDDGGRLLGYDGLISDITPRKLAEQALRRSQERLALVIEGSNDGIWDWDVATGQTYFSPRWKSMLGYEDHEIENTFSAWEQLLHPEDRERAVAGVKAYFAGETKAYELEHRLRHKDGSYRWILARGVVLRDAQGKPLRMAGSHVDLTERKLAAERLEKTCAKLALREAALKKILHQLRASHRALKETQLQLIQAAKLESVGTLAAGVAHEVKNPLQTILMGLDFLFQKVPAGDKDLADTLSDMREAVNRASSIIRELLVFSSDTEFHTRPEDLNWVIDRSLRMLNAGLVVAQTQVVRNFDVQLPRVVIDDNKIQQVFINLFLNAMQAMPGGGTLTVTTRQLRLDGSTPSQARGFRKFGSGDVLVVAEVQDTGSGIPEFAMARIFDPFFTTKPPGVGTGLGLSIAKKIIDLHGGEIQIRNQPAGGVEVVLAFKA